MAQPDVGAKTKKSTCFSHCWTRTSRFRDAPGASAKDARRSAGPRSPPRPAFSPRAHKPSKLAPPHRLQDREEHRQDGLRRHQPDRRTGDRRPALNSPRGITTCHDLTIGAHRTAGVKNIAVVHRPPRTPRHRVITSDVTRLHRSPAIGLPQFLHLKYRSNKVAKIIGQSGRTLRSNSPPATT